MKKENKEKEINWKETRLHIRKLIKNNDYTIVEFSNKMCMSDSAIKNYLYGKVIPSVDVLHHMVRVFGLLRLLYLSISMCVCAYRNSVMQIRSHYNAQS